MIKNQTVTSEQLVNALNNDDIILITANKRLASHVRELFEQQQILNGKTVWHTPTILPWSVWLQQSWQQQLICHTKNSATHCLSAAQELYLWQNIIEQSVQHNPLQQLSATAKKVQNAWQTCHEWNISISQNNFNYNNDSQTFLDWAQQFISRCKQQQWITQAQLGDELKLAEKTKNLTTEKKILLLGFDQINCQQQQLFEQLQTNSCKIIQLQFKKITAKKNKVVCKDAPQQADCVARWARQIQQQEPNSRIGIIVPELNKLHGALTQSFDEVLNPQSLHPQAKPTNKAYNFSLGLPLSHYPIIQCALNVLSLNKTNILLGNISQLLLSPFILGWQAEANARTLLDKQLLQVGELSLNIKTLRYHASQTNRAYYCPLLLQCLDNWTQVKSKQASLCLPSSWSVQFTEQLNAIGWTAGRTLSSDEYQSAQAWQDLLLNFSPLDLVCKQLNSTQALSQLQALASHKMFQVESDAVNIQVLGLLEANEIQFDYIWLMGIHDKILPRPIKVNAFIPLVLQKQKNIPRSSASLELDYAQEVCDKILHSANEVIVSYAQQDDGGELINPSSLIADLTEIKYHKLNLSPTPTWLQIIKQSADLEKIENDNAPTLNNLQARGGSAIFKYQAICPFRAFAQLRLFANNLPDAGLGLNPMIRGILVHSILEQLMPTLKSQQALLQMPDEKLQHLITKTVSKCLATNAPFYPHTFKKQFTLIEKKRLINLINHWLVLEKERPAFEVVATELNKKLQIANININIKIDRIDQLENGEHIVIDYKTGSVDNNWFGARPQEPQLPLYSMAVDKVTGLSFAKLKTGELAFVGITKNENQLPKVAHFSKHNIAKQFDTWQQVLDFWQTTMKNLADDFSQGKADVDPFNSTSCQYCPLPTLCRTNELKTQQIFLTTENQTVEHQS